jgi:hypothetical protein
MAALTSDNVTVTRGWQVVATPMVVKYKQLTLVLSSQGGASNTVDASTLGFGVILGSTMAQKSDDALALHTCPSYDGSKLFFYNPAQATDANRDDPADVSGTFRVLVWGY